MKGSRLAVVLTPPHVSLGPQLQQLLGDSGRCFQCNNHRQLTDSLSTIHSTSYDFIGVPGDDAALAQVCAAMPQPTSPIRILPMPYGPGSRLVAQDIGMSDEASAIARRFASLSKRGPSLLRRSPLRDTPRATIRVSLSSHSRAVLAFTVGFGDIEQDSTTTSRRTLATVMTRSVLTDMGQRLRTSPDETLYNARTVVDHHPFAEKLSIGVASTLQRGPFALRLAEQPTTRPGAFTLLWSELNMAFTAAASRLPTALREAGIRRLSAKHLNMDLMAPLSLDGHPVEESGPHALGLRPGSVVPLVCFA